MDEIARMAYGIPVLEELESLRAENLKLQAEVEELKKKADKGKAAACALARAIGKLVIEDDCD